MQERYSIFAIKLQESPCTFVVEQQSDKNITTMKLHNEYQHDDEHEYHHENARECYHGHAIHEHNHHHNGHGHHHEHHHGTAKPMLVKIVVASLLLAAAMVVEHTCGLPTWQLLLIYLIPYICIGYDTLHEAAEGIAHGDVFNEHFLMSIATLGALAIGFLPGAETQFPEAVVVMLFFQIGELFEGYAEGKSRDSIAHLMQIRPDNADVERGGQVLTVRPDEVAVGETIVIRPGGRVPLDGTVIEGSSTLNTVVLTGESMPREVTVGDEVMSGCVNLSGVIRVRTSKPYGESTVAKIIQLVEHASDHKSRSESFITRFARWYTPLVVGAAVLLAVVPLLFGGAAATWLYRALLFLVVSCPCALVISVPLTFFGAIGGASKQGILIKGSNHIDTLARTDTVVFDKTGTLTHGTFAVEAVHPDQCDEQRLLHLAAHVEHFSTHPVGAALREAFPDEATDGCRLSDVEELAGMGIRACVEGATVCVGNSKLMQHIGAAWRNCSHTGTIIHVAIDGVYAGHIVINDQVKAVSAQAVSDLKRVGVSRTVMLTGDRKEVADEVAHMLGIDEWHSELMPADKVTQVERLLHDSPDNALAFVGDGINDAPVLARADVGIAMGALGSDAAIEAADVVLMDDNPLKLATAIRLSRRAIAIARQNVAFAIAVKVAVLLLAAMGLATMWMAVFADVGVTVLVVFNAMRTLK